MDPGLLDNSDGDFRPANSHRRSLCAGPLGHHCPLSLFIFACGLTFPCVQVLGLNAHGHSAGTAAALLGAASSGFAGRISPIVGVFGVTSPTPVAATMGATSLIANLAL